MNAQERAEYQRLKRSFLFLNEAELDRLEELHEKSH